MTKVKKNVIFINMGKSEKKTVLKSSRRLYLIFAALFLVMAGCGDDPFFIPVAFIDGVPDTGAAGTPLLLTGTVNPAFTNYNAIVWLVGDAGTTGAVISGNILDTDAGGTALITAKVVNGAAEGKDYTQDFEIVFTTSTVSKVITGIVIKTQPKLEYTHGDALDLSALAVTLTYEDTTTEDVTFANFASKSIRTIPAHGTILSYSDHNEHNVTVSAGGVTAYTGGLTVSEGNSAEIIFPTAGTITYGDTLSKSTLNGGSTTHGSFAWADGATIPPAGNNSYYVEFTPNDAGSVDYTGVTGWNVETGTVVRLVNITVNKAAGAAVSIPTVTSDPIQRTITVISPISGSDAKQTIEYAISTNNQSVPTNGWQEGTEFNNLALSTVYYIFARSKANNNYNAGEPSVSAGGILETFTTVSALEDYLKTLNENPTGPAYTIALNVTNLEGIANVLNEASEKFISLDLSGSTITTIPNSAFSNCISLTSVTIPDSVTSIGEGAFNYCSNLKSVTIPNSVTSIGEGAFNYCSNLKSVTIPNSVTSIGTFTFNYCSNLESVTIPDSVNIIGNNAFGNCTNLTTVTFEGTKKSGFASQAFPDALILNYNEYGPGTYIKGNGSSSGWTNQ